MHMQVGPVVLEGQRVRLEPLRLGHALELYSISQYPDIWRYMQYKQPASVSEMETWIAATLQAQERGAEVPFAIIDRSSGHPLGSTRYLNSTAKDRGLEICTLRKE
jgi:RimJ/RimL family protein N-acetyltransferase